MNIENKYELDFTENTVLILTTFGRPDKGILGG